MLLIPKVFHRIWLGPHPIPEEYIRYGQTWLDKHPGWGMWTWRENDFALPQNWELYRDAKTYSERSDILRYEILQDCGGVYVDCDYECLQSIEPLIQDCGIFIASDVDDWKPAMPGKPYMNPALMGAALQCPLMDEIVHKLPAWASGKREAGPVMSTGPGYMTYNYQDRGIRVLPKLVCHSTHAVHHWGSSWARAWGQVRKEGVTTI